MIKFHNDAKIKSAELIRRGSIFKLEIHFEDKDDSSSDFYITFYLYDKNEIDKMHLLFSYAGTNYFSQLVDKPIKFCTLDDYTSEGHLSEGRLVVAIGNYSEDSFFTSLDSQPYHELTECGLINYFEHRNVLSAIENRIAEIKEEINRRPTGSATRKLMSKIAILEKAKKVLEN